MGRGRSFDKIFRRPIKIGDGTEVGSASLPNCGKWRIAHCYTTMPTNSPRSEGFDGEPSILSFTYVW
jgi:hypothetical protein